MLEVCNKAKNKLGNAAKNKMKRIRKLGLSFWLVAGAWATGTLIYSWLLFGVFNGRDYRYLTSNIWDWVDLVLAGFCGFIVYKVSVRVHSARKPEGRADGQLFRIVVAVLPAIFLVSALAVLVLTLATYNGDWKDARQGLATAFAALIAAVGVVVSVAVSYRTGEENRQTQREIEDQRKESDERKLDAELIKNLNDRLHEIIPRRYGDKPEEVSASYFQLAALYKDWETLSANSGLIASQRENQQRNIIKLLFGVYQEPKDGGWSRRSELDIRSLDSIIDDIFPEFDKNSISLKYNFDLSYLDLCNLDFSSRDLNSANLTGAHLEGANLRGAHLEGADLRRAYLGGADLQDIDLGGASLWFANLRDADLGGADLGGANLDGADLGGASLWEANLKGASLWRADLEGANLWDADLEGAYLGGADLWDADLWGADLRGANLEGADLRGADLEGTNLEGAKFTEAEDDLLYKVVREELVDQFKVARVLPEKLDFEGVDEELVNEIREAHKKYLEEKESQKELNN